MTSEPVDQTTPYDSFEIRLYIARWHAGRLSAKQAAARIGVSDTTWRNWEAGLHTDAAKKPWMLRQIAEHLGVTERWLRDGGPLEQFTPGPGGPGGESVPIQLRARRDSNPKPSDPEVGVLVGELVAA